MEEKTIDVGVLGGGLCGLLVGRELAERRVPYLILEGEDEVGGLARTVRFHDVPNDTGPHALYSRNKRVMSYIRSLPIRYDVHRRKVRVVHRGSDGRVYEVDYPFENGIGDLPVADKADCLEGYAAAFAKGRRSFKNLQDWIDNGLGFGIARHFMIPYNRKIWNAPLRRISMDLVKKKIEPAPVRTIVESALGVRSVGRQYQSVFLYPRGGIGKMMDVLARPQARSIRLGTKVRSMRKERGTWIVKTDRGDYRFKRLVSTIPLKELLARLPFPRMRRSRGKLVSNTTAFICVSLEKGRRFARFHDCHWLFFAGPEIFYRANMMHVFHRSRFHHLIAEVTLKGKIKRMSPAAIERRTVSDLLKAGILAKRSDVAGVSSKVLPYTYPIPTLGLPKIKERLDKTLRKAGVYLVGRNGHWDYLNMDHTVETVWRFFEEHPFRRR